MSDIQATEVAADTTAPEGDVAQSFDDLESQYDALEQTEGLPEPTLAEIKKLRAEHKKFRERWSPYEQSFAGLHPDDQKAFRDLAQLLTSNPTEAARFMFEASKNIAGDSFSEWVTGTPDEPEEAVVAEVPDLSDPDKLAELVQQQIELKVQEMLARQTQESAVEQEKARIIAKLVELGYEDANSPDAQLVLFRAKSTPGDALEAITAAHEALQETFATKAQEYLAKKSADAGKPTLTGEAPAGKDPTGTTAEERMWARLNAET